MKLKNPEPARESIRDYYREADLWLPDNSSWRVYRLQTVKSDGSVRFLRLRDRVDTVEKLREHCINHPPLNVYFSVSCFLNPSKTGKKTYQQPCDGRKHYDKNGFLFSDIVVDMDHTDKTEVRQLYNYIIRELSVPEDKVSIVFSGGGYHINLWEWFRDKTVASPIEREKKAYKEFQAFARKLIDEGFKFDYSLDNGVVNSPTADTRRVRKLPRTLTSHGNLAELVDIDELDGFQPTVIPVEFDFYREKQKLSEFQQRVKKIAER